MDWKTLLNEERPRLSTGAGGGDRSQFERDFDRSVFSTPVKRLQDKAQVFPLDPHDGIRTRLTHSLEVSSVARGLATSTAKWLLLEKKIEATMDRDIEAIASTCGLIHDLGNPPFGHAGEDAIRYWFETRFPGDGLRKLLDSHEQKVKDFELFEGNAQSLRIVTKLQILADFNGLNLTYGTLSALCKYIAPSNQADEKSVNHAFTKPGFFFCEQELVQAIQHKTGTGKARNPITFLVEAADDIVYCVADIEDAVKKGILKWSDVEKKISKSGTEGPEVLKSMRKILLAGEKTLPRGLPDDIYASAFRTAAIACFVPSVTKVFQEKYEEIMRGKYEGELVKDCSSSVLIKFLKNIAKDEIFCTQSILKLELMGRRVICDLMDFFWEGAQKLPKVQGESAQGFPGKLGALVSQNYRRAFYHSVRKHPADSNYERLLLVTDYVCGMTDSFAKRLHAELTNGS